MNLGPTVNSSDDDIGPSISADGSTLFFASNRSGGVGGYDLWQASILPVVDFNGDGIVETNDLLTMIEYWGTGEPLCDIGPMPWGDGIVDVQDLEVLMSYWGQEFESLPFYVLAYWKLDETEGTIAFDSTGEHDGTLYGEPLWQPEGGIVDGALAFDGTNDYVSTDFVLNPADGPFSIFGWIKEGAPGQVIISQADRAVLGVALPGSIWLSTDPAEGKLMTELLTPGRDGVPIVSQCIITDGAWHHIGFVWDGSYRYLYVDRAEVAKDTESFSQLESSRGGLCLGAGKNLESGNFFSGLIDDVRIYDRAVSP
ncbi:MAG: LamG-like jellyroll fold domain-containing protein [Planctomycetota bacterium]